MTSKVPCSKRFPKSCGWNILRQVVGIGGAAAQTSGPPGSPKVVLCLYLPWEGRGLCQDFSRRQWSALPQSPQFPRSGLKACQCQVPCASTRPQSGDQEAARVSEAHMDSQQFRFHLTCPWGGSCGESLPGNRPAGANGRGALTQGSSSWSSQGDESVSQCQGPFLAASQGSPP